MPSSSSRQYRARSAGNPLRKEIAGWPRVAHVQLDSAWVKRFDAFLRLARLALWMLAGIFAAGLIAVTFNTIRLQVLAQAAEIEVARLIGATDAFIRRPFYYFGALHALADCLPPLSFWRPGAAGGAGRRTGGAHGRRLQPVAAGRHRGRRCAGWQRRLPWWVGAQLSVSLSLRKFDPQPPRFPCVRWEPPLSRRLRARRETPLPPGICRHGTALGHRLRDGGFPAPSESRRTGVVIVGTGISGLAAAWKPG